MCTMSGSNLISTVITTLYLKDIFSLTKVIRFLPIATVRKRDRGLALYMRIWERNGVHLNLQYDKLPNRGT